MGLFLEIILVVGGGSLAAGYVLHLVMQLSRAEARVRLQELQITAFTSKVAELRTENAKLRSRLRDYSTTALARQGQALGDQFPASYGGTD